VIRARCRAALLVFAKAPRPGEVKTRLSPPFTPQQAADFYACMLGDVLDTTARFCAERDVAGILALHPFEARGEVARLAPKSLRIVAQRGRELSERMAVCVAQTAANGHTRILLRGSDSPLLPERVLDEALAALDSHDLAVSPDLDGGYSLIALRRPCRGLFDHAMSTGSVLHDTLSNARAAGLRCALLEAGSDIDSAGDVAALRAAGEDPATAQLAPRSLEFMRRNDLWRLVGSAGPSAAH
jgi:rSAM/selenodomain-associated transferase 1